MTFLLSKSADQLNLDDVQTLIDERVPEGAQIEFKESLPSRNGSDPWVRGQDRIGDYARNKILEEAVAFANAYGGALILGLAESEDTPPLAAQLSPVPRCAELAERLKLVFRDCIEPQLPSLEIVPVRTEGNKGVIVLRAGRSRYGPHRVRPTKECPIRRFDRCETMSMREIHDMTLNMARGTERLERRLLQRTERFGKEFSRLATPDDAYGFRVTAVPLGDEIRFDSLYSNGDLLEGLSPHEVRVMRRMSDGDCPLRTMRQDPYRMHLGAWHPMLRAARADEAQHISRRVIGYAYAEIHADGLLEYGFLENRVFHDPSDDDREFECHLDPNIPVSTLAQLLVWADGVRQQASAPRAEYAIQPQFNVTAETVKVCERGDRYAVGLIKQSDDFFPIYSLDDFGESCGSIARFEKDLWNYFGKDIGSSQGELEIVFA